MRWSELLRARPWIFCLYLISSAFCDRSSSISFVCINFVQLGLRALRLEVSCSQEAFQMNAERSTEPETPQTPQGVPVDIEPGTYTALRLVYHSEGHVCADRLLTSTTATRLRRAPQPHHPALLHWANPRGMAEEPSQVMV